MVGQTEIFLYRSNLAKNWNFKDDTEWVITNPSPTDGWVIAGDGYASFTGSGPATMTQDILKQGVTYSIRLKISNLTTGYVRVQTGTGFYDFNSNGWNEIQLLANSETFTIEGDFDGKISKVSVIEYPEIAKLDINQDISIPLNFNVADIREPDKRNANYSKTVTIPGTKNNNSVFHEIFEISLDGIFNPNKATRAVIYQDSIEIFRGIIQLKKINRTYPKGEITYDVIFLGKVANLFNEIGSKELTDLDLSEYDHTYNKTNQKNSWDTSIIKDGSTYVNFSAGNPTGEGYVYPYIDYGTAPVNTWDVNDFRPAIYVKTYIDKIFEDAGFTYDSDFFTSTFFKRLIIPHNEDKLILTDEQTDLRTIEVYDDVLRNYTGIPVSALGTTATSSATQQLIITSETYDPSNQFNASTYIATVTYAGRYNLQSLFQFYLYGLSATTFPSSGTRVTLQVQRKPFGSGFWNVIGTNNVIVPFYPTGAGDTSTVYNVITSVSNVLLDAGDEIKLVFYADQLGAATPTYAFEVKGTDVLFEVNVINSGLLEGNLVQSSMIIPKKIKQKDFLTSIVNMFNLYIETDKSDEKKLLIEPRDDYYNAGSTVDWTSKLDTSQSLELAPMGELNAKNYLYTYKSDSDYLNKTYNDGYKEIYGQGKQTIDNDFITSETKTELTFSPTPLQRLGTTDRVISRIYAYDSSTGNIKYTKHNIRILYYAGLFNTTTTWNYTSTLSGTSVENQYPYVGHFDDPSNPVIDLNFDYVRELYYTPALWSPNTLYNTYYKKMLDEITDKDSKIVTGYFYLKPSDIFALDFRNQFYVDGYYLRLNKIMDFDINQNKPVKCEFILTKNKAAWTSKTAISKPAIAFDFISDVTLSGNNIVNVSSNVYVKGEKNTVESGVKSSIVTGNNNTIGQDSSSISILSSDNITIGSGLTNVSVINSSNLTITESNVTYVNGIRIYNNGAILYSIDVVDACEDEVLNLFPTAKLIDVIDASENVVRNRGTRSVETNIDGGEV